MLIVVFQFFFPFYVLVFGIECVLILHVCVCCYVILSDVFG